MDRMKLPRSVLIWAALAVCAATILAAMTWQTRGALASERDRAAAEARADLQEKMRLALWRMDTLGATLITEEINTRSLMEVRTRFEWRESQPQDLTDELRPILIPAGFAKILADLTRGVESWKAAPVQTLNQQADREIAQKSANTVELQKRSQAIDNVYSQNVTQAAVPDRITITSLANEGSLRPVWIRSHLFLLKPLAGKSRAVSGAWIDLPALQDRLLAEARDLLPGARLIPAEAPTDDGLVLASFPLRLAPGPMPVRAGSFSAPITFSLVAGWSAAVMAAGTASFLVFGVMRLSERRASFVSAVTHELRTPLTTFRLYSDMLKSGAVREEKRGEYLGVLSREADRLSHLVENVLAFSRIERGNARSNVREDSAGRLLDSSRERLEVRLATAGLMLEMDGLCELRVRVDTAAVECILFNLIDNAAKYASSSMPPVVAVQALGSGRFVEISVRDHGPGVPVSESSRIFRAFHKSAREAAESQPGVGLGLALSRRLAREMGGDLKCVHAEKGACFVLTLPAAA